MQDAAVACPSAVGQYAWSDKALLSRYPVVRQLLAGCILGLVSGAVAQTPTGNSPDPTTPQAARRLRDERYGRVSERKDDATVVSAVDANGNPASLPRCHLHRAGSSWWQTSATRDLVSALEPGNDPVVVRLGQDSVAIQVVVEYPDGITHPQGVVASTVFVGQPAVRRRRRC